MLDALKFVQGAVARKDFVPALTHFQIKDGFIRGFNGKIALCAPIDLDLDATPKAAPFIKAIEVCRDTVELSLTPKGRLAIRSGSFRAFIDCLEEEEFPTVEPEGDEVVPDGGLLDALRVLAPFTAEDASRPWAQGVLFRGPSAFATNNVIAIERWLGYNFPVPINVPKDAIQELLRIGEEPMKLSVSDSSVTFHFSGGRWLRTQTHSLEWPDISRVLDVEASPKPFPDGFFEAVEDLTPFVDAIGSIYFREDGMSTSHEPGVGASVAIKGLPEGCFHYKQLEKLNGVATKIDFSLYPKPCPFYGDRLRGVIVGMRLNG